MSNEFVVERACQAFQKSVNTLIAKIQKRSQRCGSTISDEDKSIRQQRKCQNLVRHANHVLKTLTAKRTSLKHAIQAFGDVSKQHAKQFAALEDSGDDDDGKHAILREWFANYLRLRDGFVLLESGERRHPHDDDDDDNDGDADDDDDDDDGLQKVRRRKGGKIFPSRLSDSYRRDGVTRKFSSRNGYTGAGYDEAYDEDVGIRQRLLVALSNMDAKRWSVEDVWDRTFDKDGGGARMWEMQMDEHINESKFLREDLNRIQLEFVNGVNEHLAASRRRHGRKGGKVDMLKLVTDDKSERITLGLVDIARQGDAFTINDAGGSLPVGMSVRDWRKKFGLVVPLSSQPKIEQPKPKKKRKFILEDSSDEEDNSTFHEAPPVQARKKQPKTMCDAHDGLAVRVRQATDVRISKNKELNDKNTLSINQLKQQHGVSNAQLEHGREQLEEEQLRSKMAADDEDMQEGFFGDGAIGRDDSGGGGVGSSSLANHAPLLKNCLNARTELRKMEAYGNDVDLLWQAQEHWAVFDESLTQWKEDFQALLVLHKDVYNGLLDESSDRVRVGLYWFVFSFLSYTVNVSLTPYPTLSSLVLEMQAYTIRDNFREANITLGNDCIDIHEFFFERLQKNKQMRPSRFTSSASLEQSLSAVCHPYLRFAEETFKTALNLVVELERSQPETSVMTIDQHWEKGQHFLLRGRAHHSIGRALYELAQYQESNTSGRWQGGKSKPKDLLLKARREFDHAVLRAKSLRRNAVLILGHADARNASTQKNCSWKAEAMMHSLEAIKLESLSSRFHVACSWKLDRVKEAEERFDGLFESVVTSDVAKFVSVDGVSSWEIAEALEDVYFFAMRVAEMSTDSLERMVTMPNGWNAAAGDAIVQLMRKAMKRAASISDQLLSFVEQQSSSYATERIATRAAIEEQEDKIVTWWDTTKAWAQKNLSDIVRSARANEDVRSAFPRREVMGNLGAASSQATVPLQRKIFVQDDRSSQGRSLSRQTRRVKKNSAEEDRAVSDRFQSEFCTDNNNVIAARGGTFVPFGTERANASAVIYRKWGDEVLEEHERKRCCPPLPDGIPSEVRCALEKKLRDILPTNNKNGQFTGFVTS